MPVKHAPFIEINNNLSLAVTAGSVALYSSLLQIVYCITLQSCYPSLQSHKGNM